MSLVVVFVCCQPLTIIFSATPVPSTANDTAPTVDEDNGRQQCNLLASSDYELVLCPADPRLRYTPLKEEWPFQFRYPRMPILSRVRAPRPSVLTLDGPQFLSVPQPLTSPISFGCSGLPSQTDLPDEELRLALGAFVLLMSFGLGVIVCWVVLKCKGDANAETKNGQIKRPPPPRRPRTTSVIQGRTLGDPQNLLEEVDVQNQSLWFQEIMDVLYRPTI